MSMNMNTSGPTFELVLKATGSVLHKGTYAECGKTRATLNDTGGLAFDATELRALTPVVQDAPQEGKTYSLTGTGSSIANGNTWDESVVTDVTPAGYGPDIDDDDDAPGYEEVNDVLEAATESLNPVTPGYTGVTYERTEKSYSGYDTGLNVSESAKARVERDEQVLRDAGFNPPPPVYAAGTRVIGYGEKRFHELREDFNTLPTVSDAVTKALNSITAEDRQDVVVPARELRMRDDGLLEVPGYGYIPTEKTGFQQLLTRIGQFPRAGAYMAYIDPELRAHNFNLQVQNAASDHTVNLRIRKSAGAYGVFAAVSERYKVADADKALAILPDLRALEDAKAKLTYNPDSTTFQLDALWMPDHSLAGDFSAGDIFKLGVRLRTNDAGRGGFNGGGIMARNLCLNLIIVANEYVPTMRLKHMGESMNIAHINQEIRRMANATREGIQTILNDWGYMRNTDIREVKIWNMQFDSIVDALTWGVEHNEIGKNIADKVLVEALMKGYEHEKGESLADFVNAITRGAHVGFLAENERQHLENMAGAMVPVFAARA